MRNNMRLVRVRKETEFWLSELEWIFFLSKSSQVNLLNWISDKVYVLA